MTDDEDWWLRIAAMFTGVSAWTTTVQTTPVLVEPGSPLSGDDQLFPALPVSTLAWANILTAVEQLVHFHDAYEHCVYEQRVGLLITLRSALVGAATTVWLLAPDEPETRQVRGLRLAVDSFKSHRTLLNASRGVSPKADKAIDVGVCNALRHLTHARRLACDLDVPGLQKPLKNWKLITTDVIAAAAKFCWPGDGEEDKTRRIGADVLWKKQSGHAHGSLLARLLDLQRGGIVTSPNGQQWAKAGPDAGDVYNSAAVAYLMTKEAFALFESRSKAT